MFELCITTCSFHGLEHCKVNRVPGQKLFKGNTSEYSFKGLTSMKTKVSGIY